MIQKKYKCEYPDCETMCNIRSRVKDKSSVYYGLSVCNHHAVLLRPQKKTSEKTLRTQNARKEQRKDYPEFYQSQIQEAQGKSCLECGKTLQGSSTEIAHIIMKSKNPELSVLNDNIIYLCESCHGKFDQNMEVRSCMKCFNQSIDQYKLIQNKVLRHSSETLYYEALI